MLVQAGADVNARDGQQLTALHLAVMGNPNPEIIIALARAGADLSAKEPEFGRTALHMVAKGSGEVVVLPDGTIFQPEDEKGPGTQLDAGNVLLKAGADVNAPDDSGRTPLHLAAENSRYYGNLDIAVALLSGGADVSARDSRGLTPMHVAVAESADLGFIER